MAKKNKKAPLFRAEAEITPQRITETIEKNYMPYAMSVIVSRAIPEIDGFKPSHRKLLYTMYKMGLLTGHRTKSANVVGQTMKLNPHGDAAIYETMVRLTRGNEALLHPFVDSKGSFGKQYSRDMAYAASRYTEVKLDSFCEELFTGIDKNAVDLVPNYDNTTTEPTLLPTTFPNVLISPNLGIAVGLACSICSFNLAEVCDGTIAMLKNPNVSVERMMDIIKAPDFSSGGQLVYNRDTMRQVFTTGTGAVRLRGRYSYDKDAGCIDILQIPYSASIESIMKKVGDMMKAGRLKEVTDFRDEIDLGGFKLTLDIRRGTDPEQLMAKLFKETDLEDNFDCNFNVLIDGEARQVGVMEVLSEWIAFRLVCYRREVTFELEKKRKKSELLMGLGALLLDIDKAIRIIRNTEHETDVVPNLMEGFSLTEMQAEYVAEIKLRHLNREYILRRISEIEELQKEIAELEALLQDEIKLKERIAEQLRQVKKKYGQPRKTQIISADDLVVYEEKDEVENYNVRCVLTKEGYFKKITAQSLRGNDVQLVKEGDEIVYMTDTDNLGELFVLTNKAQAYKCKIADIETVKASVYGLYLPAKLNMDEGEIPILGRVIKDYQLGHHIAVIFENGKGLRIPISQYETKTNRRKLTSAFSSTVPVVSAIYEEEPQDLYLTNSVHRAILFSSALLPVPATKSAGGNTAFQQKYPAVKVVSADVLSTKDDNEQKTDKSNKYERYRKRKLPATGILIDEKGQ